MNTTKPMSNTYIYIYIYHIYMYRERVRNKPSDLTSPALPAAFARYLNYIIL